MIVIPTARLCLAHLVSISPTVASTSKAAKDCSKHNRSRFPVQFEEETAGVAEDGAILVAAPERGRASRAVLTNRLCIIW